MKYEAPLSQELRTASSTFGVNIHRFPLCLVGLVCLVIVCLVDLAGLVCLVGFLDLRGLVDLVVLLCLSALVYLVNPVRLLALAIW